MSRTLRASSLGGLLALASGCGGAAPSPTPEAAPGPPWFEEGAAAAGIAFVHRSGHREGRFLIPEVVAGGGALLDADDDGRLDVYLVQSGELTVPREARPGNALFRNRGGRSFEDVSAASGADDRGYGMGAATGDADGDGRIDLYVTNVGPNVLLRNRGEARFEDVTAAAGVGDPGFGSSAAFFDADRDGDLDLFVANYLVWSVAKEKECSDAFGRPDYCAPALYNAPATDVLYRNRGAGTFEDVTAAAGLAHAAGTGLGVVAGDFDGDGWPDLFVANDGRPNRLWINQGEMRFEDRGLLLGCAMDQDGIAKAGMGIAVADLEDDGDLDLLVANLRRESDSLFRNVGGAFADETGTSGLWKSTRHVTRFGIGWFDFDDDGWLDLFEACGRVAGEENPHSSEDRLAEPNLLFRGQEDARWEEVTPRGGTAEPRIRTSRGAAFGDLDGDGGVDVVVANRDAPPDLLWNVHPDRGRWLQVRALDPAGRDALGARIDLTVGGRTIHREVRTASSYCAASDPRVHFGLGSAARVEGLRVRWPDGIEESFPPPDLDRELVLRRGSGVRSASER